RRQALQIVHRHHLVATGFQKSAVDLIVGYADFGGAERATVSPCAVFIAEANDGLAVVISLALEPEYGLYRAGAVAARPAHTLADQGELIAYSRIDVEEARD